MADLINEIVSQEAFEQITLLESKLKSLTETMDGLISLGASVNKAFTGNSVKTANDALQNYNNTTEQLTETLSQRLVIETKLKENEAKMAASIKVSTDAIDKAKQIWKSFALGNEELADRIAEATIKLEEQKQLLKDAKGASNYKQILASTTVESARLKAEISEYTKEMKRNIQQMDVSEDSIKSMSAMLAQATDQWSRLSEEERNSEFGQQFQAGINELDAKLKGLEGSVGNYKRMVGGYLITGESMRMQLREIVAALAEEKFKMDAASEAVRKQEAETNRLANTLGKNSQEYIDSKSKLDSMTLGLQKAKGAMTELEREGGKLQDAMGDARQSIKGMADDAGNTKAVAEGVGVLADSFSVFQAGMVAVGADGEDLMKVYAKMMILQQGFNSLTQITNALQAESTLRLKLKSVWYKVNLVFTQKKTAATIAETAAETTNTAATTAGAAATAGLATAEGVATKTSWTLVGSLKAVGSAIKSIPVVGWILAAVAALGTLTVLLYKHISAEKELTAEQIKRKQLADDQQEINQKANESTLETITRVKLLEKGLNNVKKGSKEWQSIVKEINDLTGQSFDTLKATPAEISKATKLWIEQYKIRAKAEATIQKMVQNELDFQQLSIEVQTANDEDRKTTIDKLKLTKDQKDELLEQLNIVKGTVFQSEKNLKANAKVMNILGIAKQNMLDNNATLEKGITLEGLLGDKTDQRAKSTEKIKNYELEIRKAKAELYLSGEDLIKENTQIELALEQEKYNEEIKKLKEQHKRTEQAEQLHQLAIQRIVSDGYTKLGELRQKAAEDKANTILVEYEKESEIQNKFVTDAQNAQNIVLEGQSKMWADQLKNNGTQQSDLEKQIELNKQRTQSVYELVDGFSSLGYAIASNIKDEKKRIIVEQRIAEVQLAVTKALAIAEVLLDKKGDPYTKAIRIAANLAVVVAGFIQAENAINSAGSVSAYSEGTDYHKGGAAIVGEGVKNGQYQPELLTVGNKSTWITEPTFIPNLPIGASVTPISEIENKQYDDMRGAAKETKVYVDVSGNLVSRLQDDFRSIKYVSRLFHFKA